MNRDDLYLKFAAVVKMCKGTKVKPENGWKFEGVEYGHYPFLDGCPADYTFIVAVVEDRPVFPGDRLYTKASGNPVLIDANYGDFSWFKTLTWTKHKLTFSASMTDLPVPSDPMGSRASSVYLLDIGTGYGDGLLNETKFYFKTAKDRNLVADRIINILYDASKGRL